MGRFEKEIIIVEWDKSCYYWDLVVKNPLSFLINRLIFHWICLLYPQFHSRYFLPMDIRLLLIGIFLISCGTPPPPKPITMPSTKKSNPELIQETIFSRGYMTEYDVWETLRQNPSEQEVIETFGLPDSVWLDEIESTKFLYYFIFIINIYCRTLKAQCRY